MTLTDQLIDYINAAFTGLWGNTHEPDEAEREIIQLAIRKKWKAAVWDVASGVRMIDSKGVVNQTDTGAGDPLTALRALPALADADGTAVLLLHNFHRFLNSPEVIQTTFAQLVAGKQQRTFIVILSPVVQIPVELEKLFVIIEHSLPDREQLQRIARELTTDTPDDLPKGTDLDRVLDAAAGLTRYEAEGAFALSLTKHHALRPDSIWELKAQALKKSKLLTLHRGGERFGSLGGLANLKEFCQRALRPGKSVKPRGVLLLGVPGTGKSAFAKALGTETGRPTLILNVGALYGSLVGATEANVRQALRVADAMAPCILFVDEVEKGLSGVGGQGDSGVSTRLFGTMPPGWPTMRLTSSSSPRPTMSASYHPSSRVPSAWMLSSSSICPSARTRTPSGRCTARSTALLRARTGLMTRRGPAQRSVRVVGWQRCWI